MGSQWQFFSLILFSSSYYTAHVLRNSIIDPLPTDHDDHSESYLGEEVEMGETVGIHHLHCTNDDEVESGSCLAVAYQVRQILQKLLQIG